MSVTSEASMYGLDTTNVLMLTLDCCRADTAERANIPYLKQLGRIATARTHGTYTLPAHMSFFAGYLPIEQETREPYYNPNIRQLWRLESGRSRALDTVGLKLEGAHILEGYGKLGYHTLGVGGVRWFRSPTLTSHFDEFMFYGPDDTESVFTPRRPEDFALNHLDEITDRLSVTGQDNFFLFVNCLETHVPYDTGEAELTAADTDIIERAAPIWGCKSPSFDRLPVSAEELQSLHSRQIAALETIDPKIEKLISQLAKPLLVVIAGDHGECFGEDGMWGHGNAYPKVMDVPLLIATVE